MSIKSHRHCAFLSFFALFFCALTSQEQTQTPAGDAEWPLPFEFSPDLSEDYDARMERGEEQESEDGEDTRSFLCLPMLRIFNVQAPPLAPGQRIAVVGDHERLGRWQVERGLEMKPSKRGVNIWTLKVPICANRRMHYRYMIYSVDTRGRRRVQQWEGVPYARVLEKYQMYRPPGMDEFARISPMLIADVEREWGWLRHEYAIELQFVWQHHIRLYRFLHMPRNQQYFLKLSVFDHRAPKFMTNRVDTDIWVSRYAYNQSAFRAQPRRGVSYAAGDILIFRIVAPRKVRHNYLLSLTTQRGFKVGETLIYGVDLRHSEGVLRLPIYSPINDFQVGRLTLPYLLIRPLKGAASYNLRTSFHRYWPLNWPTLDIGHRGAGISFDAEAAFVENTISSFLFVHKNKGDMIQLDVHLTRDYVPVVFHDFSFKTARKGLEVQTEADLEDVLIKDLTFKELKNKRIFFVKGPELVEYTKYNVRNSEQADRLFPTLQEVFKALPKTLGINVEVKWPQLMADGEIEYEQSLSKNHFVDVLLQITADHGCGRPLFFSSFDANICTLLRFKQNIFPVVFLTIGETALWEPYKDLRTRSFAEAVNFAQSANLLGTGTHAEDFMDDHSLADLGLDLGQAVFLWGEDLNDVQVIEEFKKSHVSGLIYDRYEVYGPRRKRDGFFNATELIDMFRRQCIAVGHVNCTASTTQTIGGHGGICEAVIKRYA